MGAAPFLTILKDGTPLRSVAIEGEAVLGRSEGCVIRLEDRAISRRHAVFRPVSDGVQIERQSEFAPLKINGAECTHAILKEGDIVEIGPYLLKLTLPAPKGLTTDLRNAEADKSEDGKEREERGHDLQKLPAENPNVAPGSDFPDPNAELAAAGLAEPTGDPLPGLGDVAGLAAPELDGAVPMALGIQAEAAGLESPALALSSPSLAPAVADDSATRVTVAASKFLAKLRFRAGDASVEELVIEHGDIVIGRGKSCDIVLRDKKSSRKNTLIRREGAQILIKDLDSSNGTYVNGEKIFGEVPLEGGARIRIGEVEFEFDAVNPEYEAKKNDFLAVPAVAPESVEVMESGSAGGAGASGDPLSVGNLSFEGGYPGAQPVNGLVPASSGAQGFDPQQLMQAQSPGMLQDPMAGVGGMASPGAQLGMAGIPGIAGMPGSAGPAPKTLIGKGLVWLRAQPKPRQYMVTFLIIAGLALFLFDEEEEVAKTQVKKPAQTSSQQKPKDGAEGTQQAAASFDALNPEQKKFVEAQHALAFEHYRNKEYDRALFEIGKIFSIVNDYKDAREIERYSREGKRKREAIEEEKRRKEEEARLKAKIAQLEDETRSLMTRKLYVQARELFSQILAIDPENKAVVQWRQEIQAFEEDLAAEAKRKEVQKQITDQAWNVYLDALGHKKAGRYHSAIQYFGRAMEIAPADRKLQRLARANIRKSRAAIASNWNKAFAEAKQADESGEAVKALALYGKATRIDPNRQEPYTAIERIRAALHDKGKALYTEAVLAESYSDFASARKRYQEILEQLPSDDLYYERATRKMNRYLRHQEETPQ